MSKILLIILLVLILIVAGVGWAAWSLDKIAKERTVARVIATSTNSSSTASGSLDASSTATTSRHVTIEAKINQSVSALGIRILPLSVVEDSRCPLGVMCIQAGTVKIRALLSSDLGPSEQALTLNQPITIGTETVSLVAVEPLRRMNAEITPSDYVFRFEISKI